MYESIDWDIAEIEFAGCTVCGKPTGCGAGYDPNKAGDREEAILTCETCTDCYQWAQDHKAF